MPTSAPVEAERCIETSLYQDLYLGGGQVVAPVVLLQHSNRSRSLHYRRLDSSRECTSEDFVADSKRGENVGKGRAR